MPTVPRPTHLPPGQVRTIDARDGITLRVLQGRLWLTQPGDAWDHFLEAGATIHLVRAGVLVQADAVVGACASSHSAGYVLHTGPATANAGKPMPRTAFERLIGASHFIKGIGIQRFI